MDPASPEANYQFLKHELGTTQSGAIDALKKTHTVDDATKSFRQVFEGCPESVAADGTRTADANMINKLLA